MKKVKDGIGNMLEGVRKEGYEIRSMRFIGGKGDGKLIIETTLFRMR